MVSEPSRISRGVRMFDPNGAPAFGYSIRRKPVTQDGPTAVVNRVDRSWPIPVHSEPLRAATRGGCPESGAGDRGPRRVSARIRIPLRRTEIEDEVPPEGGTRGPWGPGRHEGGKR